MVTKEKKAIALYSGGLDSILAIKLIQEQGIEVVGLYIRTPFLNNKPDYYGEEYLNIPLIYVDLNKEYQEIMVTPKYGFGKNKNPCIDCRISMFKKAGEIMIKERASFIISGEVLGQRPMSQCKKNLILISEESGFGKFILRPLSALLLPETESEKCGLIDRSKLLDIQGRSRKRQMELAKQWKINRYPSPAGGCKLTEPGFAHRVKDLLSKKKDGFSERDIELLKIGRHFNIDKNVIFVVGRNEKENKKLLSLSIPEDYIFSPSFHKGPVSLLRIYNDLLDNHPEVEELLKLTGRIIARYCDKEDIAELIDINIWRDNRIIRKMTQVPSLPEDIIKSYII